MPQRNVQELWGLKPEETNALAVLAGLEGYHGGKGEDVAAVAANALQRRLHGGYGGKDIRNIATQRGQYAAILDRGITAKQLGDPAFGAKVLGGAAEFERLRGIVNNPEMVGAQYPNVGYSFRAPSVGAKKGDYMPVPGKSNFYFDKDPATVKKGLQIFQSAKAPAAAAPVSSTAAAVEKGNNFGQMILNSVMKKLIPATIQPQSSLFSPEQLLAYSNEEAPLPQDFLDMFL